MVERRTLSFSIPEVRVLFVSLMQVVFIHSLVEDFINFRRNICRLLNDCPVILFLFIIFLALFLLILKMTRYSLLWGCMHIVLDIVRMYSSLCKPSRNFIIFSFDMETVVSVVLFLGYIVSLSRVIVTFLMLLFGMLRLFNKNMSRL